MVVRKRMATSGRTARRATKRSASGTPKQATTTTDNTLQAGVEWSNDHEFLSPHDIYEKALGLLYCLTTKQLSNVPYTTLYRRSLKNKWTNLLQKRRQSLKSNNNSVRKCFMINRLIAEYEKGPIQFTGQTAELYDEIQKRMATDNNTAGWSLDDFYNQVHHRRTLQGQRRLFYISHEEAHQPCSLMTLQRVATQFCMQLITTYQQYPSEINRHNVVQFFQYCFIIVQQPSIPECFAATKYEKSNNCDAAKLFARIICLIDPSIIDAHLVLPSVEVKLRPFDRHVDEEGEDQTALPWQKRPIVDASLVNKHFYFVELESIELRKLDIRNLRPLYRAQLCQLEFNVKFQINATTIDEKVTLFSKLFGVCSHAQYYPENVAKVILHEVTETLQSNALIVQPNILTDYIKRYHIRVSGVRIKEPTSQYIRNLLQKEYDQRRTIPNSSSTTVYKDIVAKLVSQMELYIDHPFLSMMYQDGLFLGICDDALDHQLSGTRERPHLLLRSNTLQAQDAKQHPLVRFIIHDGQLTKATFHPKAFIDEMCRMICQANSERARMMRVSFQPSDESFHDFSLYFDQDLHRLNSALSSQKNVYQPLIPTLLNHMRTNNNEQEQGASTVDQASIPDVSPRAIRRITHDTSNNSNEAIVRQLVDNFFDHLTNSSNPVLSTITTSIPSIVISGDIHLHKEFLYRLVMDALPHGTSTDDIPPTVTSDLSWLLSNDES